MILQVLLGGMIVAGILAAFWDDLLDWLKTAVETVRATVRGIYRGVKVFVQKTGECVKEISKHYSQVGEHWEETVIKRTIPASEVPEDILMKAYGGQEVDITDELELQLSSH